MNQIGGRHYDLPILRGGQSPKDEVETSDSKRRIELEVGNLVDTKNREYIKYLLLYIYYMTLRTDHVFVHVWYCKGGDA